METERVMERERERERRVRERETERAGEKEKEIDIDIDIDTVREMKHKKNNQRWSQRNGARGREQHETMS